MLGNAYSFLSRDYQKAHILKKKKLLEKYKSKLSSSEWQEIIFIKNYL